MVDTNLLVADRFKALLKALNLNVPSLAKAIGYERSDKLYNISNGKYLPSFEILSDITKKFVNVNANWLISGKGGMFIDDMNSQLYVPTKNESTISIPMVDILAAAGCNGHNNPDYIETVDHIKFPDTMLKKNEKYLCIRIKGESMSPTLLDSTYVVIRLMNTAEWEDMPDEHVYVVSDKEGRAYIKRLKNRFSKYGFIVCMSDNPDKASYPNFNLSADEINSIWHAEWYFSAKMPNIHETYYNKIGEMQDDIDLLKNQYFKIMKTISK